MTNKADDDGGVLEAATNYPNIFFLMHKWFTTSESLANDLRQLFEAGKPSYHGDYSSLLASIQQKTDANGSQEGGGSSSRPPSVILSRKQVGILLFYLIQLRCPTSYHTIASG